jgi:hypothetical protein
MSCRADLKSSAALYSQKPCGTRYCSGGKSGGSSGPSGFEHRSGMKGMYSRCSIILPKRSTECIIKNGVEVLDIIWACILAELKVRSRGSLSIKLFNFTLRIFQVDVLSQGACRSRLYRLAREQNVTVATPYLRPPLHDQRIIFPYRSIALM